jgi:hypothetical protein
MRALLMLLLLDVGVVGSAGTYVYVFTTKIIQRRRRHEQDDDTKWNTNFTKAKEE